MKHKWETLPPMGVICAACFQCKCCGPVTYECKDEQDDEWFREMIRGGNG